MCSKAKAATYRLFCVCLSYKSRPKMCSIMRPTLLYSSMRWDLFYCQSFVDHLMRTCFVEFFSDWVLILPLRTVTTQFSFFDVSIYFTFVSRRILLSTRSDFHKGKPDEYKCIKESWKCILPYAYIFSRLETFTWKMRFGIQIVSFIFMALVFMDLYTIFFKSKAELDSLGASVVLC